jgi:UbiD family decarboxylase
VKSGPVKEVVLTGEAADVTKLPLCIWTRGEDPAPYVTGPCVISRDPETGERNMGTYRLMQKGPAASASSCPIPGATCTRTS